MSEIYADIADLSGVRVSLYFPGDRAKADRVINNLFTVAETKKFPVQSKQPSYNKRFSGYWATHYRASMKEDSLDKTRIKYAPVRLRWSMIWFTSRFRAPCPMKSSPSLTN